MRRVPLFAFLIGSLLSPLRAETRQDAILRREYAGAYQDQFNLQFDRVRLLTRQAQLEVSARLGLFQFREGFRYPLEIRFEDGAPPGIEHAVAYVRFGQMNGAFAQELVVNMALSSKSEDFDQIFLHEMTHAVLNDAVGGEASLRVPHWVQEGLAQYVSEEGEPRVKKAVSGLRKSEITPLLADLDGAYTGLAYPQYYLAVKYMFEKHSSNSIQALVRNLIAGQPLPVALQDATGLSYPKFTEKVHAYSTEHLRNLAKPDF